MRPYLAALLVGLIAASGLEAAESRALDDAALHAVQFVDENEGWAVGDEGLILHTIDGGRTWEHQGSGTRASLRSLHFLTPWTGWVVGREEMPHGGGSLGVLLATTDGGLTWQKSTRNALPGLNAVRFLDGKTGFAAGDGSDLYPSGMFTSGDGGQTWKPVQGQRCPSWLTLDVQDARTGIAAGAWGRFGTLRQGVLGVADVDALGGRAVHAVRASGNWAVAVGQGGLVLVSRDTAGATWGPPDGLNLTSELRTSWDFRAVHVQGDEVWAAGRPGSALLYSPDRGRTWETRTTGQPLPLNGLFFLDARRGWAVGECGSVLVTQDGGKSWRVQRRGGQRVAVLLVHARPVNVPLDTVAVLGAENGYLAAALRVAGPDPAASAPRSALEPQRLAGAMRGAGGAAGEALWQFPLPQHRANESKADLLSAWNRLYDDRAAEELVRQLVLALRVWRPEVVLTDNSDPQAGSALESLVAEAMHQAYKRAGDPAAFPEQIRQLGLEPWEVKKLYAVWHGRSSAQVLLDLNEVRPRLEASARAFVARPAGLLHDEPAALPGLRAYRLLEGRLPGSVDHADLMQGINLPPGGTARRALAALPELTPQAEQLLRQGRNLLALAEAPAGELTDPNRVMAQVGPALQKLPEGQAVPAAFAMGNQFARSGQWHLAREVFLTLVNRYPEHPLSVDAYRWLIRHDTSGEARHRRDSGQFIQSADVALHANKPDQASARSGAATETLVTTRRELSTIGSREEARQWYKGTLELGDRLAKLGPAFAGDPSVQFCLQSARRNLGDADATREWYARYRTDQGDGPWREAAASELWLLSRSGTPPKPATVCRHAASRPHLDGRFDDACWEGLRSVPLRDAAGDTAREYPTEAMLAYDKDYLYLAVRCGHPAGQRVPPAKARGRDADLRPYDRVGLLIDLDRDYSTYYHLQIDQRGCAHDACWGDATWNPRWFVAVAGDAEGWQAEAAIPLSELTGDAVTVGKAWAFNVTRTLPGRGVQSFSAPADVEPRPEGLGLLVFLSDKAKP